MSTMIDEHVRGCVRGHACGRDEGGAGPGGRL